MSKAPCVKQGLSFSCRLVDAHKDEVEVVSEMKDTGLIVAAERFSSATPPDQAAIQRAVALWLAKELNKPHQ